MTLIVIFYCQIIYRKILGMNLYNLLSQHAQGQANLPSFVLFCNEIFI